MSEKTKEVPQLADATYAHTLVIKSTHEYKVHGPYGSNFPCTIGATGPLMFLHRKMALWIMLMTDHSFWSTQTLRLKTWFAFSFIIADRHDLASPSYKKSLPPPHQNLVLHSGGIQTCITLWDMQMQRVKHMGHHYHEIPQKVQLC